MKKTSITSGAGFLGSHLCEKLLEYKAKQRKPDIILAKKGAGLEAEDQAGRWVGKDYWVF